MYSENAGEYCMISILFVGHTEGRSIHTHAGSLGLTIQSLTLFKSRIPNKKIFKVIWGGIFNVIEMK